MHQTEAGGQVKVKADRGRKKGNTTKRGEERGGRTMEREGPSQRVCLASRDTFERSTFCECICVLRVATTAQEE